GEHRHGHHRGGPGLRERLGADLPVRRDGRLADDQGRRVLLRRPPRPVGSRGERASEPVMARRLTWLAVGVVATVVVLRKGRAVVDTYLPAGTTDAIDGVQRVSHAVATLKSEFLAGMAEREQQLRHDLVGDVDVEALRAE